MSWKLGIEIPCCILYFTESHLCARGMQANVMSQWNGDRKHDDHVVEEEEKGEGEEEGATSGSLMEENIDIDTDTHRALKRHRKHETTSDSSFQVGSKVPLVVVDSAPRLGNAVVVLLCRRYLLRVLDVASVQKFLLLGAPALPTSEGSASE